MKQTSDWKRKSVRATAVAWKVAVWLLALAGLVWLVGAPLLRLITDPMFQTEVIRRTVSPDKQAVAEVVVRRGITVSTIRVRLDVADGRTWIVYEKRDSDFSPPLRWADTHTLVVGLPCGRFDHVANPDDWEDETESRPDRFKVRFERPKSCN